MMEINLQDKFTEFIGKIPLAITNEHHHVFPYWCESGLRNVSLIHVDSHSDLADVNVPILPSVFDSESLADYLKKLEIGSFICPTVHSGLIKDIFWINPFQRGTEIYIQYLGENLLETENTFSQIKWKTLDKKVNGSGFTSNIEEVKLGECVELNQLKRFQRDCPYILDVDLDAFAKEIEGNSLIIQMIQALNPDYGVTDWEKRINKTQKLLRLFPTPSLITLTRSQGKFTYVPPYIVDRVQNETIKQLKRIYH